MARQEKRESPQAPHSGPLDRMASLAKRLFSGRKTSAALMPKTVPERNLEKMLSNAKGGMIYALNSATIGSAGTYKGLSCAATNFWYDKETREISAFSNRVKELEEHLVSGSFVVAADLNRSQIFFRIVSVLFSKSSFDLAISNLNESMRLYNEKQGKSS